MWPQASAFVRPASCAQRAENRKIRTLLICMLLLLLSGLSSCEDPGNKATSTRASPVARTATATPIPRPTANMAVLTSKNDNLRTGQQTAENRLTVANLNASQFGLRTSYPVDGKVYAQPLYVPNLSIAKQLHNVVFVATEHDSVYAFDADQRSVQTPLWRTSFIDPAHGIVTLTADDVFGCPDLDGEVGITSTPVIDSATQALYVVATTKEHGAYVQRLHALDLRTGHEKSGSPRQIQATVPGTGDGSVSGFINFNPKSENQRAALLLDHGIVYIAWASYCDKGFYHGWIIGYNARTLRRVAVYNTTPAGYQGGIWQGGGGLAADDQHHLFVSIANGTFNLNAGGQDASSSILKLSTQNGLQVDDYFTAFNQACLEPVDADVGSTGVLLLPDNELVTSSKEGRIYLVNRNKMGGYTPLADPCAHQNRSDVDDIDQELPPHTLAQGMYTPGAFWQSSAGNYVYLSGVGDHLKVFALSHKMLTLVSQTTATFNFPGAGISVSSNGSLAGTAILWVLDPKSVLHAYDASDLHHELYNSNQNASRDALPSYVKFTAPTVANGEVFIGTKHSLQIYGLLSA